MTYIMVDVEIDGPIPSDYALIALGVVVIEETLARISHHPVEGALGNAEALLQMKAMGLKIKW
ncbi:MAG: hypothetical protein KDJ52_31750 [Anaerolineae bacterium]|nr:hypothetical protein [Anaerolineae bacterium]